MPWAVALLVLRTIKTILNMLKVFMYATIAQVDAIAVALGLEMLTLQKPLSLSIARPLQEGPLK